MLKKQASYSPVKVEADMHTEKDVVIKSFFQHFTHHNIVVQHKLTVAISHFDCLCVCFVSLCVVCLLFSVVSATLICCCCCFI